MTALLDNMRLIFLSLRPRHLAMAAGMATLVLGLTVLVGWHGRVPRVIQLHPNLAPMQYNTALGFLLAGGGLLTASLNYRNWSIAAGGAVSLIGLFTLAEYLLGADLGIDQVFMVQYLAISTPHPGRMAPNTALCFLLAGCAIILTGFARYGAIYRQAGALLAALVVGLGTVALAGYATNIPTAYGWGNLIGMALHTALGFIVLGVGLIASNQEMADDNHAWLPVSIGVATGTVTISLWQALHAMEQRIVDLVGEQGRSPADEFMLTFGLAMSVAFVYATKGLLQAKRAETCMAQLNQSLEQRVQDEVAKNREKDFLLIQQSRLATMGELLHNVAHQWRQPLNALALLQGNIKDAFEYGDLTPESMTRFSDDGRRYIQKMSTTIDDFRSFFLTSEEITHFNLAETVRNALGIMDATFRDEQITVAVETPVDVFVDGLFNELSQALLNVLINAKDAIKANRRKKDGAVIIWLEHEGNMGVVRIRDNGGGIPDKALIRIFDPYFSTKSTGSGIGLYMARMVIHHMHGRIEARNVEDGAEIMISIPASRGELIDEAALSY